MKKLAFIFVALMLVGCAPKQSGVVDDWENWNNEHDDKVSFYMDNVGAWSDGSYTSNGFFEMWKKRHSESGERIENE